ncbi:MAG TPA: Ku protein [Ideonella sp.]|uniref:non-homologous end joining protein Ku n=1 Tax=Ideonella sp. TaxID=1929293 RepID=UPI002E326BDE|nr:Ku protein [Ideonella sp.]HEX5683332.1 Ku protein [Ideonella sp.]
MPRAIWKGAVSFGLVHIPVVLYPASQETEIDFDWLDKRTLDPVGYKRINKRTGREIDKDHIVKGVKQDKDRYVVLSDDEIREAFPKTTQTIEIQTFVPAKDVSFMYMERPYYLEPVGKSDKVYALLREAIAASGLIGIARVVMHNKEHLAALLPAGQALMLATLRWANEIRDVSELNLPPAGKAAAKLKDSELKMATRLVKEMASDWEPKKFTDRFSDAIRELVARKAKAGKTKTVEPLEEGPAEATNVVDLTELLKQSLGPRKGASRATKTGNGASAKPRGAVTKKAATPAAKKAAASTARPPRSRRHA